MDHRLGTAGTGPWLGLLTLLLVVPAGAAERFATTVAWVVDASTVELAGGQSARLAGIVVPPAVRPAADALVRAAVENSAGVEVERVGPGQDRYRRQLIDLFTAEHRWLQGLLVGRGLALVDPTHAAGRRGEALRDLERGARESWLGIWRTAPVFDARDAGGAVGRFALVRGEVLSVGSTRNYIYLNFGPDYRTDFTLRIRAAELDHVLSRYGIELERLPGRVVEARGFALFAGGPLIELSHPEQIEVIP